MDEFYQVRIKGDTAVLFIGFMYECERWIHENGQFDVTYEIERATPLSRR